MPTILPGRSIVTGSVCIDGKAQSSALHVVQGIGQSPLLVPVGGLQRNRDTKPLSPSHPCEPFDLSAIPAAAIPRDTEGLEHRAASHERGRQSMLCEGLRRRGPVSLGNATRPLSAGSLPWASHRHPGALLLPRCSGQAQGPGGLVRCDLVVGFL